jgi:drug/metabolite transporter (DMT)-like permease
MQKLWQGIFWKVFSCGCFAAINVLVRYLSGGSPMPLQQPLPIYTIMFWQNLLGMLLLYFWIKKSLPQRINIASITHFKLHTTRIISAILGIGLWYLSLRYIPVTEVVALSFMAPIITTILAVLFLKENFGLQRKLAVFLSILGGFLIARPDQTLMNSTVYTWYMLLPLLAAFVFSLDKVLTRKLLVLQESPRMLAFYLLAFSAPLCLLPVAYYGWVTPTVQQAPWLLLLGVLGALAHYTFNKAYEVADITFLLPFGAAKLILCATFSYMAFYEIPKTFDMWLGIIVLTASTMILGMKPESFQRKKLAADASLG